MFGQSHVYLGLTNVAGLFTHAESGSFWPWVVSAKFWGESIRPMLVGRFGRESFRPWVVSAQEVGGGGGGGGTLIFSAYI